MKIGKTLVSTLLITILLSGCDADERKTREEIKEEVRKELLEELKQTEKEEVIPKNQDKQTSGSDVSEIEYMQFYGHPPQDPEFLFGNAWNIYAEGVIDDDAARRLSEFIQINQIPARSTVILSSPGGSLIGGINIGHVIRDAGLYTRIGRKNKNQNELDLPGECYSAGALAFLGGKFRAINSTSKFGVHRFNSTNEAFNNIDIAQIASAIVVDYFTKMGIDPKLFIQMTSAGSDSISILNKNQLIELKIVNNQSTTWSIQNAEDLIYVKGEQETSRGINKLLFYCIEEKLILHAIFDSEGRGEEIVDYMNAISIHVDGDYIPIDNSQIIQKEDVNGMINVLIEVDRHKRSLLNNATRIGLICQYYHDAPTFFGFDMMNFVEGAPKMRSIIKVCNNNQSLK